MKTIIQFLFFFCIITLTTYSQWFGQSPKPLGNNLKSIDIINDNIIWAVGDNGALIKSGDGGNSWQCKPINNKYQLQQIKFLDELNGFICGRELEYVIGSNEKYYGIILTTNDGGNNWILKYRTQRKLNRTFFFNALIGWAVADSGKFVKTTNGGADWTEHYCGFQANLIDIKFFDEFNGWMISTYGDGGVFKSTDGGNIWSVYNPMFNSSFYCMSFISANTGWVCSSEMFKTIDGGQSWTQLSSTGGTTLWSYIQFVDEGIGWCSQYDIITQSNNLLKSIDGGISWSTQSTDISTVISSADFLNTNFGCAVGAAGTIITTVNGGDNWLSHTTKLELVLNKVDFPSTDVGYAIGRKGSGTSSTYFTIKSTDGGDNWEVLDSLSNSWFIDLDFASESRGWVAGANFSNSTGFIINTENGGNSWSTQFSYPGLAVTSIHFTDDLNGWASIASGDNLLNTTNGGNIWEIKATGHSFSVKEIFFINDNFGWVVGSSSPTLASKIIRTTDRGLTWQDVSPPNIDILNDVCFINEQIGWVVGNHGIVIKTTNGGESWLQISPLPYPVGPDFRSVDFVTETVGWIVTDEMFWGYESSIFYTTNGGETWDFQAKLWGTKGSMQMLNQRTGWLVSGHSISGEPQIGYIYKTTNGGVTFIEEEKKPDVIPDEFSLLQNHPNPFNPNTKIIWQSPVGRWQTLKVYDVLGNEIVKLVDEYKPAGNYEVDFNARGLSSGVYLYRLQAGDFVQTRKMILIK